MLLSRVIADNFCGYITEGQTKRHQLSDTLHRNKCWGAQSCITITVAKHQLLHTTRNKICHLYTM